MVQTRRDVEGCRPNVYRHQVKEIDKALDALRGAGFGIDTSAFRILERERNKLLSNIGVKLPRATNLLARFVGFSPGVIALFHDNEEGFMVEARRSPQAAPVYHLVPADIAMIVLRHDISPELEESLMTPDLDIDN
jgi:hypothetical protein